MAFTITIPYVARELVVQLEAVLGRHFGVPMSAKLPTLGGGEHGEDGLPGRATIHFEGGSHFVLYVLTGVGHFGRWVRVTRIRGRMWFHSAETAEAWIGELQRLAGPLEWSLGRPYPGATEGTLRFTVEGNSLGRLQMAACNRRNDLPTMAWDDPENPLRD